MQQPTCESSTATPGLLAAAAPCEAAPSLRDNERGAQESSCSAPMTPGQGRCCPCRDGFQANRSLPLSTDRAQVSTTHPEDLPPHSAKLLDPLPSPHPTVNTRQAPAFSGGEEIPTEESSLWDVSATQTGATRPKLSESGGFQCCV